jgi:hypothetical protein
MVSPREYFVITERGRWGPIPWQNLRLWLALGWLPKDIPIQERSATAAVPATSVERLWLIAGRPFTAKDPSDGQEATTVPVSPALRLRLVDVLGWPGNTNGLNYFNGDWLRLELEKIFLSVDRPEFRDPEWPSSLKRDGRAEAAIWQAARDAEPATDNQKAVLAFFGKPTAGVEKGTASETINALFAESGNKGKWEQHRGWSAEPATEKQLFRLQFAAKRLRRTMPPNLNKQSAHDLIDEWFQGRPELENAYQEYKIGLEEREIEKDMARFEKERHVEQRKTNSPVLVTRALPRKASGCAGLILIGCLLAVGLAATAAHLLAK